MAERTEIDCQITDEHWLTISQTAYLEIESLCTNKSLGDLFRIARLSSTRFVLSLSHLGPELDLDYAAEGHGRLYWLIKIIKERQSTPDSQNINDTEFVLVMAQTYLAWHFLKSYYLIKNFPLLPKEQQPALDTLKSNLQCTYAIVMDYQNQLPCDFAKVQDDLMDLARGRIRILTGNPNFDMEIPYFRSQKQS